MLSIFIVEDHSMTARGLASYLAESGRWLVAGMAASIEEAQRRLPEAASPAPPNVILLDLQLAGESGLNLIAWLREHSSFKKTPVVVYSHFDDAAHRNAAIQLGAAAYVCKSQSDQELENTLIETAAGGTEGGIPDSVLAEAAQPAERGVKKLENMLTLLTRRETEIFLLIREGFSAGQIAGKLCISRRTVENHLSCIYDKTGMKKKDIVNL
jgi:DNA-binding NarL/FixJ family response regulator